MSIRNLRQMLQPRSVALIGASEQPGSVGGVLLTNLLGFGGRLLLVNPRHRTLMGQPVFPEVAALPVTPDLAVIATPPATVPGLVEALGRRGCKAAVVITAGFGETAEGGRLTQAMLQAARPHLLRILGPNCLGLLVPGIGLNASFAHLDPAPGRVALVAQSGAILASMIDWAAARGLGFSHLVSLGQMADVDAGDMLDYLAGEPAAATILLYLESVTQARKFMSAARIAARSKPLIVIKSGRRPEAARAVASHTGALAGADAVYEAAFQRAGMLRVGTLREFFGAVEVFASAHPPAGERLAILTNGGGMGILATDALIERGGRLAELAPATRERLDAVLPPTWSHGNPVDIIGDAPASRYADAAEILLEDRGIDALLVLNCPTAITSSAEAARAVLKVVASRKRCVLTSWIGDKVAQEARQLFSRQRIPTFETPEHAVGAFMHLVRHRQNQESLMQTPASVAEAFQPDLAAARDIVGSALNAGTELLSGPLSARLLAAYAIPVLPIHTATDPAEAARLAAALGGPVALKILSPDITHKSDVAGVVLNLLGPAEVESAAAQMLARVRQRRPAARVAGFTLEPMASRKAALELIVGLAEDPQFGPVVLFGQGGVAVEVIADRAVALPPLNLKLARELIGRTRVAKLLAGYRDRPAADLDAIALTLLKVAQLAADLPEVVELDINPLLADEAGVLAVDARVRLRPATAPGTGRFAIRPYPKELEEIIELAGRRFLLRPVRAEDEEGFKATFLTLSPESIRMRFFAPVKELTHAVAARLTQLDYHREMALVATDPPGTAGSQGYAVVRLSADPDGEAAEFALLVRDDMQGKGLGRLLMERILGYARRRGIREVFGHVLAENTRMLELASELGFTVAGSEDSGTLRLTLPLAGVPGTG